MATWNASHDAHPSASDVTAPEAVVKRMVCESAEDRLLTIVSAMVRLYKNVCSLWYLGFFVFLWLDNLKIRYTGN